MKQNVTFFQSLRYTVRNMKKEIVIGISTILLVATPALAAPGNGKAGEAKNNTGAVVSAENRGKQTTVTEVDDLEISLTPSVSPSPTLTPTITPTVTETQKHKGKGNLKAVQGAVNAQEVCDPDADWKNHGAYVSCVAKTHPGGEVVSAAAHSNVGKKHQPTATPSATPTDVTPTPPVTSAELVLGLSSNPLETFIKAIGRFFKDLPFFHKHK